MLTQVLKLFWYKLEELALKKFLKDKKRKRKGERAGLQLLAPAGPTYRAKSGVGAGYLLIWPRGPSGLGGEHMGT